MPASDITSSARRDATVLTLLGLEVQELASTLPDPPAVPGEAPSEYSWLAMATKLTARFDRTVNPTYERSQLHAIEKKAGE